MTREERVTKGAAWLDQQVPGWERKIDLSNLDLGSCYDCVCGQAMADMLGGIYESGFEAAQHIATGGKDFFWAWDHGFYFSNREDIVILEGLWAELIKERFNTGSFSDA